jgi:hypothetical protein
MLHGSSSIAFLMYSDTDRFFISLGRHSSFSEQALQDFVGFTLGV